MAIKKKIVNVRPAIVEAMDRQYKGLGLSDIAEVLGIKKKGKLHDASGDAMMLFRVCKKKNVQMKYVSDKDV